MMTDDASPVPVPDGWTAERDGGTLTLQSPDTVFWTLTAVPDGPNPAASVEGALEGLREEYEDLDAVPIGGSPLAPGEASRDAEFFVLDSHVTARLRAFRVDRVTYMIFYQGTEKEVTARRDELEALGRRAWRGIEAAAGPPAGHGARGLDDAIDRTEFPPTRPR